MDKMNAMRRFMDSEKLRQQMNKPFVGFVIPARGGKSHWQMEKVKEFMENGGKTVVCTKYGGFFEMNDEVLMSNETVRDLIGKEMDEMILAAVERGDMHIDLCKTADAIHQNAVEHGWWEDERSDAEVRALIHSEWSEALEEARAGRPLEWYGCLNTKEPCMQNGCGDWCDGKCALDELAKKPEGIAVELIDGVIRILDLLGKEKFQFDDEEWELNGLKCLCGVANCENEIGLVGFPVAEVVDCLHFETATDPIAPYHDGYMVAIGVVFAWIRAQGMEPEAILMRKHRYNTTRPYKHGKKF